MVLTSLDKIVRDFLMRRGYSLHWYIPCMVYAKNCLRELHFDDLRVINTKKLPVNQDLNTADLPNDYVDWSKVGVPAGQNVRPLVQSSSMNALQNRSDDLQAIPYNSPQQVVQPQPVYGYLYPFYWNTTTWNQFGESLGRFFGFGAGVQDDTFKVVPERNQIQLTENLSTNFIVLEYISDGQSADAATRITPYAFETISAYILYQLKEHGRHYTQNEALIAKSDYIRERKILRARISDFTLDKLKRLAQKASYASPKTL